MRNGLIGSLLTAKQKAPQPGFVHLLETQHPALAHPAFGVTINQPLANHLETVDCEFGQINSRWFQSLERSNR